MAEATTPRDLDALAAELDADLGDELDGYDPLAADEEMQS